MAARQTVCSPACRAKRWRQAHTRARDDGLRAALAAAATAQKTATVAQEIAMRLWHEALAKLDG